MILQSLVRLYDSLEKSGKNIPRYGFSTAKVWGKLILNGTGELIGFMPLVEEIQQRKKIKKVPAMQEVPYQYKRSSGIKPNFLCDGIQYLLGITGDALAGSADKAGKAAKRAKNCFEEARKLHLEILADCQSREAVAVRKFFTAWQPEMALQNETIKKYISDMAVGNMVIEFDGNYAHEETEIKEAWQTYFEKTSHTDSIMGQCLVTGEKEAAIAKLHPAIKGIYGAQSSGASLVSFNSNAFESYGHDGEQGLNAPVSQQAAFKYGAALNYLIALSRNTQRLGDTTLIFWTDKQSEMYVNVMLGAFNGASPYINERELAACLEHISAGRPFAADAYELSPEEPFYVLGLAPNAARLSVRFFLCNSFGNFIKNIMAHHERMNIDKPEQLKRWISLWQLAKSCNNSHAKDDVIVSLQAGAMLRSVLLGMKYPVSLFRNIMLRIFAERDEVDDAGRLTHRKIDYVRAAFIKAYLLQNVSRQWEGELQMSLNKECRSTPYVLGRMFAVLEGLQKQANPDIKATIKDRYFNAACTSPAATFIVLLKLANAHMRKIGITHSEALNNLVDMLVMPDQGIPFPKKLNLEEQGAFIVGYYQETQAEIKKAIARKQEKNADLTKEEN